MTHPYYLQFMIKYQSSLNYHNINEFFVVFNTTTNEDEIISYHVLDVVDLKFFNEIDYSTAKIEFKQKTYFFKDINKCKIMHVDELKKVRLEHIKL